MGTVKEISVRYTAEEALQKRLVQISPAELFKARYDQKLKLTMIDVRPEAQYNLFHLRGALNFPLETLRTHIPELLASSAPNAVYVVMSNDETLATEAWRLLVAEGVPNVYLLEGGLNAWIAFFGAEDPQIQPLAGAPSGHLQFAFPAALGDRYQAADPDPIEYENLKFEPKIQLQIKRDKSGGAAASPGSVLLSPNRDKKNRRFFANRLFFWRSGGYASFTSPSTTSSPAGGGAAALSLRLRLAVAFSLSL